MNILVTGGSGRIGGYALRELLRAGHSVSSYSRRAPLDEGVRHIKGDITDLEQLKKACVGHDAVLHLVAILAPGLATPERLMEINLMGTVHVLEAAVAADMGKMVFASSIATLGTAFAKTKIALQYFPIDEEHPCEPQDGYGLSKLLGEFICKKYSAARGIQTICLRIGSNWYVDREGAETVVRSKSGPMVFASVEDLWNSYKLRRDDPKAGSPPGKLVLWDLLDARDTAQACRLALENDQIVHDVFHIIGDETCTSVKTAELVSQYYPDVPLRAPLPGNVSLVSIERAKRVLGYSPRGWRNSDFEVWWEAQRDPA